MNLHSNTLTLIGCSAFDVNNSEYGKHFSSDV